MDVIFTAKHIQVKKSKSEEILSRKWDRDDLCLLQSFYNFYSENVSMEIMWSDVFWC